MTRAWFPLDPEPRLPRELVADARRYKTLGRPELAGALWLPGLAVVITVGSRLRWNGAQMMAGVGALFGVLSGYVFWRRRAPDSADRQ